MVKLIRDYRCAPEGHTVVLLPKGTVVEGRVADWALSDGAAMEVKPDAPTEVKRKRGRPRKNAQATD